MRSATYAGGAGSWLKGQSPASHLPLAARPAIRVPWRRLRSRSYWSHSLSRRVGQAKTLLRLPFILCPYWDH